MTFKLANRIVGSPDIYLEPDRETNRSINFVTCHDGFTLNDLVSYNVKHNEANLEGNRDGYSLNHSWNCGKEGPTDDPAVESLRIKQIKNFLTILLTSQGTPMMLMGDEVRRTQQGNNNAYCQDSELTWFDWSLTKTNADLLRFVRGLIHFTRSYSVFHHKYVLTRSLSHTDTTITWHGVHLNRPDFSEDSHSIAFELKAPAKGEHVFAILNAFWEPLAFEIPPSWTGQTWHRLIDTSLAGGEDYVPLAKAPHIGSKLYQADARSTVVLVSK